MNCESTRWQTMSKKPSKHESGRVATVTWPVIGDQLAHHFTLTLSPSPSYSKESSCRSSLNSKAGCRMRQDVALHVVVLEWISGERSERAESNNRWPHSTALHFGDSTRFQEICIHPGNTHRNPLGAIQHVLGKPHPLVPPRVGVQYATTSLVERGASALFA